MEVDTDSRINLYGIILSWNLFIPRIQQQCDKPDAAKIRRGRMDGKNAKQLA